MPNHTPTPTVPPTGITTTISTTTAASTVEVVVDKEVVVDVWDHPVLVFMRYMCVLGHRSTRNSSSISSNRCSTTSAAHPQSQSQSQSYSEVNELCVLYDAFDRLLQCTSSNGSSSSSSSSSSTNNSSSDPSTDPDPNPNPSVAVRRSVHSLYSDPYVQVCV